MGTTSILTCKMTMVSSFLVFLCFFFILIWVLQFITAYEPVSSSFKIFFIFISHLYVFILLQSFVCCISISITFITKNINGVSSSLHELMISIINSIHQVQHKSTRFMVLIIVGFHFITFSCFKFFSWTWKICMFKFYFFICSRHFFLLSFNFHTSFIIMFTE